MARYDPNLYHYDPRQLTHEASVGAGAILYRSATLSHCNREQIIDGRGPLCSNCGGRFHIPQQPTTYCATNALVCISEVLFHMYRRFLRGIEAGADHVIIRAATMQRRVLVAFRVNEISDIVYVDTEGARIDFHPRITGTAAVFPDESYDAFVHVNTRIREEGKNGVFYPSARHYEGYCLALFKDNTSHVLPDDYIKLTMTLRLVPEDQDPGQPPMPCEPYLHKIHPTMGFYSFDDVDAFNAAMAAGNIHPASIPASGLVDFVRRHYRRYPVDAVR